MLYTLAQATDPQELVNLVNELIRKGYAPHGSLCVLGEVNVLTNICLYVQAMVKNTEESAGAQA